MKKSWVRNICVLALLTDASAFAGIQIGSSHLFYSLLLSDNPRDWQSFELAVLHDDTADLRLLDLAAERISLAREQDWDPIQEDVQARLVRTLGESKNGRYRTFLAEGAKSRNAAKLTRYLTPALATLPKKADSAFVPGQLSVDALKIELSDFEHDHLLSANGRPKTLPAPGTPIEQVYVSYGLPDHLRSLTIPLTRTGNFKLFYYGLGIVQFNYMDDEKPYPVVELSMPEAFDVSALYSGKEAPLAHALACAHDKYFMYLVMGGWDTIQSDQGLMSVLQEKLVSMANTENDYGLKGIAIAIKNLHLANAALLDATLQRMVASAGDAKPGELAQRWLNYRSNGGKRPDEKSEYGRTRK